MFGFDQTQDYFEFYVDASATQFFVHIRHVQYYREQNTALFRHWLV